MVLIRDIIVKSIRTLRLTPKFFLYDASCDIISLLSSDDFVQRKINLLLVWLLKT